MKPIEKIFSNLKKWRNFPNYQLERRVDIFFSIYLPEIMTDKLNTSGDWFVIPEFPVSIKALNSSAKYNLSIKIDYLLINTSAKRVVFLELKTDDLSINQEQEENLIKAKKAGLEDILENLKMIFSKTESKMKYYHLFMELKSIGLVEFDEFKDKIIGSLGVSNEIENINILESELIKVEPEIIYLIPRKNGDFTNTEFHVITFKDVINSISKFEDEFSINFKNTLEYWASSKAGDFE